jgi:hypothetical protein
MLVNPTNFRRWPAKASLALLLGSPLAFWAPGAFAAGGVVKDPTGAARPTAPPTDGSHTSLQF